jgi:hypothetical protein
MDALEFRMRCLEMAERIHMRSADNNVQNILETFRKIENDIETRLSPTCPETPEEEKKTAIGGPQTSATVDKEGAPSSALKGKGGKTTLD